MSVDTQFQGRLWLRLLWWHSFCVSGGAPGGTIHLLRTFPWGWLTQSHAGRLFIVERWCLEPFAFLWFVSHLYQ